MNKKNIVPLYRLFFGVLTLTTVLVQLHRHVSFNYDVGNFFSYFTNLSNIFIAIVFLGSAVQIAKLKIDSVTQDIIRGSAVTAMALVGIVFALLLRNENLGTLLPWVNFVLHYLMPVVAVGDWLLSPPKTKLSVRQVLYWAIYPFVYLVYTLIRGSIVHWYPYPFVNPTKSGGYIGVAGYCLIILIVFFAMSWLLVNLANKRSIKHA